MPNHNKPKQASVSFGVDTMVSDNDMLICSYHCLCMMHHSDNDSVGKMLIHCFGSTNLAL